MLKKFGRLSAAALLTAGLSAPASAGFINGSLSFSDGLDAGSLASIVNALTVFDISGPTIASGGTGDFAGVAGLTATSDIDITAPGGTIYALPVIEGGFAFTLANVSNIVSSALSCNGALCNDAKAFTISGTVTGIGFDATNFEGNFTANGTCTRAGQSDNCEGGSQSASWSSSVVALGTPVTVPVPATLALFGLGLLGLGVSRKKKA
jgi:hypothetical protein